MTTILATTRSRRFRPVLATYAAFAAVTALTLGTLTGCASEPEPTPSATPAFASEAEAFEAAEEVFTTYVAALNDVVLSDPASFEAVYTLLSGRARSTTAKELSELHAASVRSSGVTAFSSFEPISYDVVSSKGSFAVCLDVSDVSVVDASGDSLVDPNRADVQALLIAFTAEATTDLTISSISADVPEDFRCA